MLIQVVRNETIPCGRRELITSEVQGGAQDEQHRTGVRKQERQQKNRQPGQGLAGSAGADECLAVREPSEQLDRCQLSARSDQLGKGRQDAQLKRAGSQQEGKGGKVLFAAALGNGLAGAIPKAVAAAWFSQVLFDGLRKAHCTRLMLKSAWLNLSQTACVWYEIGVE